MQGLARQTTKKFLINEILEANKAKKTVTIAELPAVTEEAV